MIPEYRIEKWREVYPPNPAMLRLTLERDGYVPTQWSSRPGMMLVQHKSPCAVSHWIVSGSFEISVERVGTFVLEAGDRGYLSPDTYHTIRMIGEQVIVYMIGEKLAAPEETVEPLKKKKKRGRPRKRK